MSLTGSNEKDRASNQNSRALGKDDPRLYQILDTIGKMAALEFGEELPTGKENDVVDAIILGLNMLSEELQSNVVEKSALYKINDKLEKFALTAAHDLKSPINSIAALVSLLEKRLVAGDKKEIEEYVNMLKSTTEKMKDLVQGILNYSRYSPADVEIETIHIEEIVRHISLVDRVTNFAQLQVGELPVVRFNKSALIQIFRNILSNAIKYNDQETCTINIQSVENPDHYEIQITDNGPGIPSENQSKIFELFTRGDKIAGKDSHGIGLASVKSILTSFNEKIWVESTPGKGATFCFTLNKVR